MKIRFKLHLTIYLLTVLFFGANLIKFLPDDAVIENESSFLVIKDSAIPDIPTFITTSQLITNGSLNVKWTEVANADNYSIYLVYGANYACWVNTTQTNHTFTFYGEGDVTYAVTARNTDGESGYSPTITIDYQCPPPPPEFITKTHTNTNGTLKLEWKDNSGIADNYTIYVNDTRFMNTTHTNHNFTFYGITDYKFEISGWNEFGESNLSEEIIVTTNCPPVPPQFITTNQTITNNSIILFWEEILPADNFSIYIRYPGSSNVVSIVNTTDTNHTFSFYGENFFEFAVTAWNEFGESDLSLFINISSQSPPPPPEFITTNQTITNSSMTIFWSESLTAVNYSIYIKYPGSSNVASIVNTTDTNHTFSYYGISSYEYAISAWNEFGESELSAFLNISTLSSPIAPEFLTTSQIIMNSSLTIFWTEVDTAMNYSVYLRYPGSSNVLSFVNTTKTNHTFYFYGNSTYEFAVSAWNEYGESLISPFIQITYLSPPLPPIFITENQTITEGELIISWTEVDTADNYTIYIDGTKLLSTDLTNHTFTFYGIASYNFTITATSMYGESTHSEVLHIITQNVLEPPVILGTHQNLTGPSNTNTTYVLEWNPIIGADNYSIYVNGAFLMSTTSSSHEFTFIINGTTEYRFQVTAWNIYGESALSNERVITVTAVDGPGRESSNIGTFGYFGFSFSLLAVGWFIRTIKQKKNIKLDE